MKLLPWLNSLSKASSVLVDVSIEHLCLLLPSSDGSWIYESPVARLLSHACKVYQEAMKLPESNRIMERDA